MRYDYATERKDIFTEDGLKMVLSVRDRATKLIKLAGCARMDALIAGETGSSWAMLACVDYLVEIGELREVRQLDPMAGQHRIFVAARGL